MNTDWFLCARSVLPLLLLAFPVQLVGQRSGPVVTQQGAPRANPAKGAVAPTAPSLEQRCREFLAPMESKGADTLTERIVRAEKELTPRFAISSDLELEDTVNLLRECVTDLPSRRVRREAVHVYMMAIDELQFRSAMQQDTYWSDLLEKQQAEHAAELEKQRAAFMETAKFAAAIYKENEQYKEENLKLRAAFDDESRSYREMYNLAGEAMNLAKQAIGSPGLSLPAFVSVPVPQVIRVETPAVPRSLHCGASSTPNLSRLPEFSTSTTWINCW